MEFDEPVAALDSAASGGPGLGSQLMMVLLGGLSVLPAYLGAVLAHMTDTRIYLWLGIVLALADLGSVWMVSRRLRHNVKGFGLALLLAVALNVVLTGVYLVMMDDALTWSTALRNCAFFFLCPVAGMVVLLVLGLLQRRKRSAPTR